MLFISKKSLSLFFITLILILSLSGCVPVILGGGIGAASYTAMRDKSVDSSINDSKIETLIKSRLYKISSELHSNVSVSVDRGCVLLTGAVSNPSLSSIAEKESWKIPGVIVVDNNIIVGKTLGVTETIKDGAITSNARGLLMCNSSVKSINYKIKTTDGVVYVRGIAKSKAELETALNSIKHIRGVKKVVSYVIVKSK
ncbi:MAG: BON domain-containing protein [Holosporales bacterium]|jgi:osmotically-inducible protein OsmY|nr:BON domain-containing protein [Holosporales bacterium]